MEKELKTLSKYLSFIVRHKPDEIGLKLDSNGWGSLDHLIEKTSSHKLTPDLIKVVVETNDKQRFSISQDGLKIRANQGHSIDIDLGLEPQAPPEILLHGTAERFWPSIEVEGLVKGGRHHVHLTVSDVVAKSVGGRYGKPVLLEIAASKMASEGYSFYRSANNVWLVEFVPPEFVTKT